MALINDSGAITRGNMFKLNENAYEGFTQAVANGQIRMALEYATSIIAEQRDQIERLQVLVGEVDNSKEEAVEETETEEVTKPVAKKAASRKTSKSGGRQAGQTKSQSSTDDESDDAGAE